MKRCFRAFRSKVGQRALYSLLLCICLVALGQPAPTRAASAYYFRFGLPTFPQSYCTNTGNWVQGPFSINVLAGMSWVMVGTFNGVNYGPWSGPYPTASSGSGFTYAWGWFGYPSSGYPSTVKWSFTLKAADGTPLTRSDISFTCVSPGVITNLVVTNVDLTIPPAPPVAFWNPNDGRVDPRPGDRLAVWCNQSDKVVVYGIADDLPQDKSGFHLATFRYSAILAAGERGLSARAGIHGTVTVSIRDGWFWIAWNGGKYNATGQGIFVKNFEDARWCAAAHTTQ